MAIAEGGLAEPYSIIEVGSPTDAVERITEVCQKEKIEEIVVGLPLDSEGLVGPSAKKAKSFGQRLGRETRLKIIFWDEALTSEEALAKMIQAGKGQKARRKLDDISAAVILQEYIDSK